jgi:UPF0271 protein
VARFSRDLVLVGLAGSALIEAGQAAGLRVANEGFPDRAYNPDGTLQSRRLPGAVLEAPSAVAAHAVTLALEGITIQTEGRSETVPVDTLCLHGDNPGAVVCARAVRSALAKRGVSLKPLAG